MTLKFKGDNTLLASVNFTLNCPSVDPVERLNNQTRGQVNNAFRKISADHQLKIILYWLYI